ncbi:MAG: YbjN domain-containing protein [Timaviella obliquedivisa GSE-PSE-MK23-08B]|jgi:hypothetical protein|nr:YbjN domain-containing protein [Timaviella obliquedivisa GSE-PSE-MK23-08B]
MLDNLHRHLLETLKDILEEKMSLPSAVVEPSETMPLVSLSTTLAADQRGRHREVNHAFFPFSEEDLEHTLLLQFYFQLPFSLYEARLSDLAFLLQVINNQIPLGCYSLNTQEKWVQFRYVTPLPHYAPLNSDMIGEVMLLLIAFQDMFPPVIESVNAGETSLQQALEAIHTIGFN